MIEVNLFDDAFRHIATSDGKYSLTDDKIPHYFKYVRDNSDWDGITFFTDSYLQSNIPSKIGGYKIGWLIETRETNPEIYRNIDSYINNFEFLMTYDAELLEAYPDKTRFYPYGGCWISRNDYGLPEKSELVSMLYSDKRYTSGHRLRHTIADQVEGIDLFGTGADKPFTAKDDILPRYMFTIVIENTKNKYYFSEKLLDAIALGVVPIYYGATDIGDFFNEAGILTFDDVESLKDILNRLTPELYEEMLPALEENQELLYKYDTQEDWIYENILYGLGWQG